MPPTDGADLLREMLEGSVVPNALSLAERLRRAAAVVSVVLLSSLIYASAPYNHEQMAQLYGWQALSFTGAEFLFWVSLVIRLA